MFYSSCSKDHHVFACTPPTGFFFIRLFFKCPHFNVTRIYTVFKSHKLQTAHLKEKYIWKKNKHVGARFIMKSNYSCLELDSNSGSYMTLYNVKLFNYSVFQKIGVVLNFMLIFQGQHKTVIAFTFGKWNLDGFQILAYIYTGTTHWNGKNLLQKF